MCIRDFLRSRSIHFRVLLHRPAHTAAHLAGSLHMPGRFVAKGVLIRAGGGFALAVLPATHRIDLARLAEILSVPDARIATVSEVETIFADCEPGALPPFGRLYGLTTLVDSTLAAGAEIAFVGNSTCEGVRMRFRDYEAIERPTRARFAAPINDPRAKDRRKAG